MAHPELKSSVPQADSTVAAPEKIQLNFSENLTVKFSGAKLTMTGMKGMSSHSPMPVAAKVAPGADLNRWSLFRESLYPLALIVLTGARFLQIRTLLPVITPLQ
jgi:hypothetical protein